MTSRGRPRSQDAATHAPREAAPTDPGEGPGTRAGTGEGTGTGDPGRNRYVDLVRLVAITMVVVGHWLDTIIVVRSGSPVGQSALGVVGYMRWLTLLFQVMPLFFVAGGYAAAASWPSWQSRGGQWAGWTHARLERVLRPTAWFVAILSVCAAAALALGGDTSVAAQAGWAVALQLWFLPVYMLLLLLAVPLRAAWNRFGWLVLGLGLALVGVVDALVRGGHGAAAWASYLLAPGSAFVLGIAWHAGALSRRALPLALAVGGALALVALVAFGGYPPWMIGVPGEPTSNTSPPNLALAAYAAVQVGLVLLLEPILRGWLVGTRAWAAVARGNSMIMTLYLWHMVPVVLVGALIAGLGVPAGPGAGTGAWWGLRIPWIAVLGLMLAGLVAVVGRFERPRPPRLNLAGARAASLLLVGACLTGWALSRLALEGFAPAGRLAVGAVTVFAAGMLALWLAGRPAARST